MCFSASAFTIVGCQSYEPEPLDIDTYRYSLDTRLFDIEPLAAFVDRLDALTEDEPSEFDFSDGISPSEGEVLALFYNHDLRIARLEAGVALAKFETSGLWKDPVFGFNGADITSPSAPFEYSFMGELTIPISGRLKVEKARAGATYESQLRTIVDAEWNTRAAIRKQWARWIAASQRVSLLQNVIARLEYINLIADTLKEVGELNRVQHRLLQVELSSKLVELTDAELQAVQANFDLLGLIGLSPTAASTLLPTLLTFDLPIIEDKTARLIQTNTELAVRIAEYETAEQSLHVEIKRQFPDITLGSGFGEEASGQRFLIGLKIPLPILNANREGIAVASANREVARASAETTFSSLYRELATATITLDIKQSQREHYEQFIVPMLEDQSHDIERIAELGEVDTFILLETVKRQFEAKLKMIELQLAEREATINVIRILGPDSQLNPSPVNQEISFQNTSGGA
jgi:outer membrane protein TolC